MPGRTHALLRCCAACVTTETQVTSLPVPHVVGTAMNGNGLALNLFFPSKAAQPDPGLVASIAAALAASIALPPPSASTRSARLSRISAARASTVAARGLASTLAKRSRTDKPAPRSAASTRSGHGVASRPGSVTSATRVPSEAASCGNSAPIAPGCANTRVGSRQPDIKSPAQSEGSLRERLGRGDAKRAMTCQAVPARHSHARRPQP